jgi:hypothetical protein
MATGTANLGIQMWEDSQLAKDAHGSFSTRIDNLTIFIEFVCGYSSQLQAACGTYKQIVHPNFPGIPSVPLTVPKGILPERRGESGNIPVTMPNKAPVHARLL